MTISSHPWIKLLIAIIAGIVAGIILDSWGWGIATFFIAMFLFIFVASWIFGGPVKGKVEVNDELEELLDKLETIGNIKNELPLSARGWCNSLGLYAQLREMANMTRLQAGGERKSQIDAWQDYLESGTEWKVKKYDPGDWEKLVEPTREIAVWLSEHEGLPEEYMGSFTGAIEVFKKEGHLKLPDMKKAEETRKAGSYIANPTKSEDMLQEVGDHVIFTEDTKVTIGKVEQVMPAGMTFKQAYDFSTNQGWRNRIRMALLKESAGQATAVEPE